MTTPAELRDLYGLLSQLADRLDGSRDNIVKAAPDIPPDWRPDFVAAIDKSIQSLGRIRDAILPRGNVRPFK